MVGRLFRRDAFHGGGDCGIERRQVHARHTAVFDHDAAVDHDRIDIRRLAAVDDVRHQIVNGLQMGVSGGPRRSGRPCALADHAQFASA